MSRTDLLLWPAIEIPGNEALRSARGELHREREAYASSAKAHTAILNQKVIAARMSGALGSGNGLRTKESAPSLFARGFAKDRLGHEKSALADYTSVLDLDPRCSSARFNRGGVLYARGDVD